MTEKAGPGLQAEHALHLEKLEAHAEMPIARLHTTLYHSPYKRVMSGGSQSWNRVSPDRSLTGHEEGDINVNVLLLDTDKGG